ncbi:FAD binding domain-containing protein [Nocardia camponoti]|uniref:FAD-binding molybdopterin dehydrogenase n=1 Tax=Nocardia camponoti TaxID=1616106 RepID=A0A917QHY8_9NOCA|nr:FAD binding domain-containing protein [Nocardia camponoti]GGK51213.1 FAD-binding molybdopterin dehydrogenase [Nocardia camponoti]
MDLDTVTQVHLARDRADLARLGPGCSVLAGGTFLYSEPHDNIDALVDITTLGWPALRVSDAGLEIAATCTLAEFAGARPGRELGTTLMKPEWPGTALFALSCRALLASHKIWRTATVGGNVCLSLPAGAVLGSLVALDAVATVWGPLGERSIPLREFVFGPGVNALREGEVVRSFLVPTSGLLSRTSFRKIALAPLGRSGSVVMGVAMPDGSCAVTITAATDRPVVLEFDTVPAEDAVARAVASIDPARWFDDPHGAPDWRAHVTGLLAREVVGELRDTGSAPTALS